MYVCLPASHPHPEGRFAIVTNVEGGMRWTAGCSARMPRGRAHPDGRRSRVVLVPRRWDQPPDQKPGGTEANKPGTPGSARISRKTIAQGMPDVLALPVVTAACFFCLQAGHGCGLHPAFPAPSSSSRATHVASLGHERAARMRKCVSSLRGAKRQSNPDYIRGSILDCSLRSQ